MVLEMNGHASTSAILAMILHGLRSHQAFLFLYGFIKNMAEIVVGEMAQQ